MKKESKEKGKRGLEDIVGDQDKVLRENETEIRKAQEKFISGIVDEKPTAAEAHALAIYLKAVQSLSTYAPPELRRERDKLWNDNVWNGIKKLWGIGGEPGEDEGNL